MQIIISEMLTWIQWNQRKKPRKKSQVEFFRNKKKTDIRAWRFSSFQSYTTFTASPGSPGWCFALGRLKKSRDKPVFALCQRPSHFWTDCWFVLGACCSRTTPVRHCGISVSAVTRRLQKAPVPSSNFSIHIFSEDLLEQPIQIKE